jgi:predicted TIM-barrel fold metal-dependent hydrolase
MIDIHVHVNWQGKVVDEVIRHMDNLGVDKAWLLGVEAIDGGTYAEYTHLPTWRTMEAYKKYPDRFIPFCSVDPRVDKASGKLREWVKKGCKGYGELKIRVCINHPDSMEMYRVCGELGLPVLIHIDIPLPGANFWFNPDLERLEKVLKKLPETIFIGHGPGFWREISGDSDNCPDPYPAGKIMPGGKLVRLLQEYPNIYADISAGSGLNALRRRDPEFGIRFIKENYQKLLYGTDNFKSQHLDFLKSLNLRKEDFEAITHNNAAKLISVKDDYES